MNMPHRLVYERVMIPRRLETEPESGLEGLLMTLTSVALTVSGFHALGEALHATQTLAEVEEAMQPEVMGQSEVLARQSFDRNMGQPTLNTPTPMVMVESWMPVRRPIDVLDPSLRVTDPGLAAQFQRPRMNLGSALRYTSPTPERPAERERKPSATAWRVL